MSGARRSAALAVAGVTLAALVSGCSTLDFRRWREPERKWFKLYPGPMRPLEEVAVLCRESAGADIATIRREGESRARAARHEKWHYPICIEAPAGVYVLEVNFFSRDTVIEVTATITETMESAVPMTAEWRAEAGAVYALRVTLGRMAPLPGLKPRAPRESATTHGRWYLRNWEVAVDRLAGWEDLPEPTRAARDAWVSYVNR